MESRHQEQSATRNHSTEKNHTISQSDFFKVKFKITLQDLGAEPKPRMPTELKGLRK